jgi:hypothetical protein
MTPMRREQLAMNLSSLWLDPIRPVLHDQAREAIEAGDGPGFLRLAGSQYGIKLVTGNSMILLERGIYEKTLLHALIAPAVSHYRFEMGLLRELIRVANKEKLRAAGDPLPGPGPFTVFRGVAGNKNHRRVRGISWTGSFDKAAWFAGRFQPDSQLTDPGVYKAVVEAEHVLARVTARKEDEYLVLLPKSVRVTRTDWRYNKENQRESPHDSD